MKSSAHPLSIDNPPSLLEVLTLKLNFQKKNSDKTLFFMIGPYGSPFSICPDIGF